jgi:23S rRNA pseudouridine1911/1915/1917 synthase
MNDTIEKKLLVPPEYHGQRVDVVLAQLFPDFSRSQLTNWLKEGRITLNERHYKPKEKLHGHERVHLHVEFAAESALSQAENIPLDIVYEDEHLLVLNKASGLIVHPGAGNPNHTLVNALLHHDANLQHLPRAGIVHRLDKETTGLLIVAKTLSAHTSLIRQMQARDIQRHYKALVYGHVIAGGILDTYYGRHPHNRLKMAVCEQGKQAITHYSVQKHYFNMTLLDVKLMTGRTHQIRVHMAHIKHSVVGDPLYTGRNKALSGISDELRQALSQFKRQALHAGLISFTHPHTQDVLTCTAPLPDDFQSLIQLLDDDIA